MVKLAYIKALEVCVVFRFPFVVSVPQGLGQGGTVGFCIFVCHMKHKVVYLVITVLVVIWYWRCSHDILVLFKQCGEPVGEQPAGRDNEGHVGRL